LTFIGSSNFTGAAGQVATEMALSGVQGRLISSLRRVALSPFRPGPSVIHINA
jgi:hypothetical protein